MSFNYIPLEIREIILNFAFKYQVKNIKYVCKEWNVFITKKEYNEIIKIQKWYKSKRTPNIETFNFDYIFKKSIIIRMFMSQYEDKYVDGFCKRVLFNYPNIIKTKNKYTRRDMRICLESLPDINSIIDVGY